MGLAVAPQVPTSRPYVVMLLVRAEASSPLCTAEDDFQLLSYASRVLKSCEA